jgi:putative transposase
LGLPFPFWLWAHTEILLLRQAMPSGLKRYYGKGDLHFLTFSCYQHRPLLEKADARDVFVRELDRARNEWKFLLFGYVVMPEHVHLLISEPPAGTPSAALHQLKLRVAKRLRPRNKRGRTGQTEPSFAEGTEPPRSFWQARFYDFNVYSEGKIKEKLNYMHANPVVRGLVEHPKDWAWSSWSFYFGEGKTLIRMDS